ncbi:MAG: hypothetical protein ABEH77_11425 [Halobacteriaceae archaeon]
MTGPLSGAYAQFRGDPTAPMSPHSVHVAGPDDLPDAGGWTAAELYAAVEAADRRGRVVVDYGRERLYLVADADLTYRPPRLLGARRPPALDVADPLVAETADGAGEVATRAGEAVTVSPEFDLLVPAFELAEAGGDPLPPVDRRESGTGAGTGTPG